MTSIGISVAGEGRGAWRLAPLLAALALSLAAMVASLGPAAAAGEDGRPCPFARSDLPKVSALPTLAKGLASRRPLRIVAIGSSSTEGIGASSRVRAYPAQLESDLRRTWPGARIEVANAGIGGETVEQTLVRLARIVNDAAKPDLLLWQVGTNDAVKGGDPARFRSQLEEGVATARAAQVPVVLIDQQYFPKIDDVARYERYVGIVGSVAQANGLPVLSRYRLMHGWAASDPALYAAMLSGDGFHMSDQGYACLARTLAATITAAVGAVQVGSAPAPAEHGALETPRGIVLSMRP